MPFEILRGNITKVEADAIVNAANSRLQAGGGVCGSIFKAANPAKLSAECAKIGHCATGQAVITSGCDLPHAKYVIHAVGPVWQGGGHQEALLLQSCYAGALKLALEHGCHSVAFPLISSGIYGYPKEGALQIALAAIGEFLLHHDMLVYLVIYDRKSFAISKKLFASIQNYLDENCVIEEDLKARKAQCADEFEFASFRAENRHPSVAAAEKEAGELFCAKKSSSFIKTPQSPPLPLPRKRSVTGASYPMPRSSSAADQPSTLEEALQQVSETFQQTLLRLIGESGLSDVEVYKRANVDRKLFSKIRSHGDYKPSKQTAIAFAIALELDEEKTAYLLERAGYVLSCSSKFDVIIHYFIRHKNYDIMVINEALFAFEQELLRA